MRYKDPNGTRTYTLPDNIYDYNFTAIENGILLLGNQEEFLDLDPAIIAVLYCVFVFILHTHTHTHTHKKRGKKIRTFAIFLKQI